MKCSGLKLPGLNIIRLLRGDHAISETAEVLTFSSLSRESTQAQSPFLPEFKGRADLRKYSSPALSVVRNVKLLTSLLTPRVGVLVERMRLFRLALGGNCIYFTQCVAEPFRYYDIIREIIRFAINNMRTSGSRERDVNLT